MRSSSGRSGRFDGWPARAISASWFYGAIVGIDIVLIIAASVASAVAYCWIFLGIIPELKPFAATGLFSAASFAALMRIRSGAAPAGLLNYRQQARDATIAWSVVAFIFLGAVFSLKIGPSVSRGSTLTFLIVCWIMLLLWRWVANRVTARALAWNIVSQPKFVLISDCDQNHVSAMLGELAKRGYLPAKTFALGHINSGDHQEVTREMLNDVVHATWSDRIEEIFLAMSWSQPEQVELVVNALRRIPLPIKLLPDREVTRLLRKRSEQLLTLWSLELQAAPLSRLQRFAKRAFDLAMAILCLGILFPFLVVVGLMVKASSPGPVIFVQTRSGFSGHPFRIFKFRTMSVLEDGDVIRQTARKDSRVTPLGHRLRRSSLDELPQLINVVRGEMSLVGPRPHATAHNSYYERLIADYARRHHVKPGITGLAQVTGFRGETPSLDDMARRVELDIWYINHWSLWLDLKILLRTLVVVYQSSAY
jgi:Undecaprenyl-phosphate glucose phosphotransferase